MTCLLVLSTGLMGGYALTVALTVALEGER